MPGPGWRSDTGTWGSLLRGHGAIGRIRPDELMTTSIRSQVGDKPELADGGRHWVEAVGLREVKVRPALRCLKGLPSETDGPGGPPARAKGSQCPLHREADSNGPRFPVGGQSLVQGRGLGPVHFWECQGGTLRPRGRPHPSHPLEILTFWCLPRTIRSPPFPSLTTCSLCQPPPRVSPVG